MYTHSHTSVLGLLFLSSTTSRASCPRVEEDARRRRRPCGRSGGFVRKSSGPWVCSPTQAWHSARREWPSCREQEGQGFRSVGASRTLPSNGRTVSAAGGLHAPGAAPGLDRRLTSTESQWRRLCGSHGCAETSLLSGCSAAGPTAVTSNCACRSPQPRGTLA